ncbi:MAG: hypothetical protein IKZ97_01610 [Butyrivibrio sp.]|nr:hypothetical protein [Butyrivibrio sp.]
MSRNFRYVQNDDVLKCFLEFRETLLRKRPIIIARHGDYALLLSYIADDKLGISIENLEKEKVVFSREYDIETTSNDVISRGTRHAFQKMSELNDAEVNKKRLQIWKWYIMEWQKTNASTEEELVEKQLTWDESKESEYDDIFDMETYLHGAYLNLAGTLGLIDSYLKDEKYKDMFRRFAINDIMEMTSEDTKDKSIAEEEKKRAADGIADHNYRFTVSVKASDREHARQALLNYLAGDERIKVQK